MEHLNYNAAPPPDPKDLIDFKVVVGWGRLGLGFVRKRIWYPIGFTVLMGALAVGALQVMPKTYQSDITLLAKKSEYLSPDRDGKLTGDAAVVLQRNEVIAQMVEKTDLVKEWNARREPILRLKDDLHAKVFGPVSDKDMAAVMAYRLRDSLAVATEGDTITISASWRDPEMAFRLVGAAMDAFLEERRIQEVSMLSESLEILEEHSAKLEKEINDQIAKARALVVEKNTVIKGENAKRVEESREALRKQQPAAETTAATTTPTTPSDKPSAPAVSEASLARAAELETLIVAKRASLDRLTSASETNVSQLQSQLSQARAIYTEAHPTIVGLKQQIDVASQESPQAGHLRDELEELEREHASLTASKVLSPRSLIGGRRSGLVARGADVMQDLEEVEVTISDPDIDLAQSNIGLAVGNYQNLQRDIDRARLKLTTAQAAFRHRYRIVTPAEVPNEAIKPIPSKVIMSSLIGGVMIGIFIALALELRRGLIYEPWQVESALGLPVVAHIDSKPEPRRIA